MAIVTLQELMDQCRAMDAKYPPSLIKRAREALIAKQPDKKEYVDTISALSDTEVTELYFRLLY